jgi:Xaa-Pro aminopeptidase
MTYKEKLAAIRKQMQENKVDAYIITSADPHMSEYVPDNYKCLYFASGFTGSAGSLVITQDFAGLWTDFRYFVQANEQLAETGFELVKLKVQHAPEYIDWLHQTLPDGATVAFDNKLLSVMLGNLLQSKLADKNIDFKTFDFLDAIWEDRPSLPIDKAFLIDEKYTGESVASKLSRVKALLKQQKADYQLISSLDDIAWLFNIRGKDVSYNPVVLSFALISPAETTLFIDLNKLSAEDKASLNNSGVKVAGYNDIEQALASLPTDASIFIDPKRNCFGLYKMLPAGVSIVHETNPSTFLKAVKNGTEVANMRSAMIKDGVAMTKFFKWIEENIGKTKITELSAAAQLKEFRAAQDGFAGVSFNTIGGYKAHGALPHYAATAETDSEILQEGLFLVDSGGQYHYGTTDITRMIAMGNNTEEEKTDYTLVLKAMIEGSKTFFPKGTFGYQIDAICRKPLWDYKINYGHGTGHGIGFYLNVHEGPQVFNPTNTAVTVDLGMITSIEPGIYRPGKHGVRIENLVLTIPVEVNEFEEFYAFETLTLALIDTSLIKKDLLEASHIAWLNSYNQTVFEKLSPALSSDEAAWLKNKCQAI